MPKKELLEIIQDLNFWFKQQEGGIPREELNLALRLASDKRMALIIAGVRRAGKTFLARQLILQELKQIKPEQTLWINFEDPSLEPFLNVTSMQEIYQSYRYFINKEQFAYIVLDEIQNVLGWEKWVRIMMEKGENVKFIITGSSSKIFKSQIAEVLSGRTITFNLLPLSFRDFLKFKNYIFKRQETFSSLNSLLYEYLEYGSFPLVVLSQEKNYYLKELFDDIILKDIILKHKLRETEVKKLAVVILNNFASFISVKRLQSLMQSIAQTKISPTSINNYLYYFEEAFLFLFVPIFSYKIVEQSQYPRKVYSVDTGLVNAISLKLSQNLGRLYENVVAVSLWRRVGKENLFYWKNAAGREVDFVVKEGLKVKQLIQVCYSLSDKKTKEREIRSLLEAIEDFKLKEGTIITENYEDEKKIEGKKIRFIPLWKWLLQNK
ncbi:MAG: ATP-binding protein [Nanoarchaeota archaeon]